MPLFIDRSIGRLAPAVSSTRKTDRGVFLADDMLIGLSDWLATTNDVIWTRLVTIVVRCLSVCLSVGLSVGLSGSALALTLTFQC